MARDRLNVPLAFAAALILPVALAACGRKGGLDLPPGAAVTPPAPATASAPAAAPKTYIDPTTPTGAAQQAPTPTSQAAAASQPPKKTFILDFILR